ncbi:hypothetical protein OPV22_008546 [Ensete ventricosum]|uniref:CASP-like protein n=1 Tax=Ensete ventricosum TaxID=4639 RepID=A0AAV8PPZ6_ENSVE|nr:hypothetical protein OPV22_008546 [Ensete ventricosum]
MESQFRPGFDGTQGYNEGSPPSSTNLPGYILRVLAVVFTLISTVVMGAAKEIVTLLIRDPLTNETTTLMATVKSTYSAGYVYFVIVNAVVLFWSVIALVISMVKRGGSGGTLFALAVADLVMLVLLFSGNGAATAISVVAENGQENLAGWDRICDAASKFCTRVNAAIAVSMLASVAYLLLVLLGMIALRRRSY